MAAIYCGDVATPCGGMTMAVESTGGAGFFMLGQMASTIVPASVQHATVRTVATTDWWSQCEAESSDAKWAVRSICLQRLLNNCEQ